MQKDLDASHLRELAAKCRRIALNLSDETDAMSLLQMAKEYDVLADRKDPSSRPPPPRSAIS
jgi:hypothetical protein